MKKAIIIVCMGLLAQLLVSCGKKDRTCICTTTNSGSSASNKQEVTYKNVKRKDARRACVSTTKTEADGTTTREDCVLKLINL